MKVAGKFVFSITSVILVVLHLSLWIQDNHAFAVRKVVVSGVSLLSPEDILSAARIDGQEHIMQADVHAMQERVKKLPQIADVRISRIFPSSVRIEVQERKPVALLVDNGIWGVDSEGVLLPRFNAKHGMDYPVIIGSRLQNHLAGTRVDNARVAYLAQFLGELKTANPAFYNMISEVSMNDLVGVKIVTVEHGLPVLLGKTDLIKKCNQIEAAWPYLQSRDKLDDIRYLDLRYENQIVAKRRSASNNRQG